MRDSFLFALDSVWINRRRTLLTVAIIAVGVASLVGIQTAVSILAEEVAGSLGRAGAGLFTLQAKDEAAPISFREAALFRAAYPAECGGGVATVWTGLCSDVIIRSGGAVTDPVVRVLACDEDYLSCQGVHVAAGRNFTLREVEEHQSVALLGDNVRKKLFGEGNGLGEMVSFGGGRYRVVGILSRQGALFGTSLDGSMLIPIDHSSAGCRITVRV